MALWIVGLGLEAEQLTWRAAQVLTSGAQVILRTGRCQAASWLTARGIPFETLDDCYDRAEDFDQLQDMLAARVAGVAGDAVYGVLDLRDQSVSRLTALCPQAQLLPGVPVEGPLWALAPGPCQAFAACDLDLALVEAGIAVMVREIGSPTLASEVKIALMDRYPEQSKIFLWTGERVVSTTLDELDRQPGYDHRTCCFVPAQRCLQKLERMGFSELARIAGVLRGPDGCPWDRAQTHTSLRPYVVEEAWEVVDAIDRDDPQALCEELGDLLLQVALHAHIARQYGEFTLDDVTSAICRKMVDRHPHVFGGAGAADVDATWEAQKRREKGQLTDLDALRGVAQGLPALMRAQKVLKKADRAGQGLDAAPSAGDEVQVGQALLALCESARKGGVDAESALKKAVDRFIREFSRGKVM